MGDIAQDLHVVGVGVGFQLLPLDAELVLQKLPEADLFLVLCLKSSSACGIVTPRQSFPRQALRNRCLWRGVLTCVIISVR